MASGIAPDVFQKVQSYDTVSATSTANANWRAMALHETVSKEFSIRPIAQSSALHIEYDVKAAYSRTDFLARGSSVRPTTRFVRISEGMCLLR